MSEEDRMGMQQFLELLQLEEIGHDTYRAPNPDRWPGSRVFGGQVAAQAVRAVQHTVEPARALHSLHAYFIRPGRPGVPIELYVERPRDGRSFTSRRVKVAQAGEVIFDMIASFHRAEEGPSYQLPIATDVPDPEDVEQWQGIPGRMRSRMPLDMREVGATEPVDGIYASTRRVWFKTKERLPDDPALHTAVLTFCSDMGVVSAARAPVAGEEEWHRFMGASLDHAVWFHRPIRADEWILFDLHAVSNFGARGLAVGTMHTHAGDLGVSVAQEALIRPIDPSAQRPF